MPVLCRLVAAAAVIRTHVAIENIAVRYAGRPGLAPAGEALVLCFAKEKYPKERRPAVWVPPLRCGHLAVLKPVGVTCKLAALKQARALIRPFLRSSAQPGRAWGGDQTPHSMGTKRGWIPDRVRDDKETESPNPNPLPHPVEAGPSSADGGGRSGQTCLSRRRVVWTAAEVKQRRLPATKWRDPDVGSPFFSLGFFGEAKKSNSPAGATPGLVMKGTKPHSAQPVRGKK